MSEKSIVTQSELGDLKLALAQEADSLLYHAGESLSKSHGFNIVSGPESDAYGNDLRHYCDSAGDIIGTKMLMVTYSGVNYFAPISPTGLAGQDATEGVVPDFSSLLQPGGNAWVTDYAKTSTADAEVVQSGLLLPHTRLHYGDVHGGFTVVPHVTYDSKGHTVGTHVLQLYFNEKIIWIPCSDRMGGPVQPPRIEGPDCPVLHRYVGNYGGTTLRNCPCFMRYEVGGGESSDGHYFILRWDGIKGTKPINYSIQGTGPSTISWRTLDYGAAGADNRFEGNVGILTTSQVGEDVCHPTGVVRVTGTASINQVAFGAWPSTPGGDNGGYVFLRLQISNSAGTYNTCPVYFWIQDNT